MGGIGVLAAGGHNCCKVNAIAARVEVWTSEGMSALGFCWQRGKKVEAAANSRLRDGSWIHGGSTGCGLLQEVED